MNFKDSFDYENNFYLTAPVNRISKFVTHLDLFRKISKLRGEVVECGVFKGISLMRWIKFRSLLENPFSRKIIAFDTFGDFPKAVLPEDRLIREKFIKEAGSKSITKREFKKYLEKLNLQQNIDLIKGDIVKTAKSYIKNQPGLRIALLHIDVDLFEPTKISLEIFFPRLVKGGVLILDDYGAFPGANKAIEEYFKNEKYVIEQFNYSNAVSFIIKK